MTSHNGQRKITVSHLQRSAYLYVRQSSLRQVLENTESTKRQYALREQAVALGWPRDHIVVIDTDQGQSGASSADREGFKRLVSEVGLGRAGIVMGLEVSRLARNSSDWHRLLEICALSDTLILDEDGLYDPSHFNDRLLLGLKGTMSEAELHVLKARLHGGILNKARRGELKCPLPIGFIYATDDKVQLDPDQQVQKSIRLLFDTFSRTDSATATMKHFRSNDLLFPRRIHTGPNKGELAWADLDHSRVLDIIHNPRYAGAFVWGRSRKRPGKGRGWYQRVPREDWISLVLDAHPGYITWAQFEQNEQRLKENAARYGLDRRRSPPREGPALLQGLAVCGQCGKRMTIRYNQRKDRLVPTYTCCRDAIQCGAPDCQVIPGATLDDAIGKLLVEAISPVALDVALSVQKELQQRLDEADQLRQQQVERARYDAELARRRYMRVDPDNRLVASSLEAEWNEKLREFTTAQEVCEHQKANDRRSLGKQELARIAALATDFPRLWGDPATPHRERKRMARLLIEDVTLLKGTKLTAHVRFRGGANQTITLPVPLPAFELRRTPKEVVEAIDELLDHYTDAGVAEHLNERGYRSGTGKPLNRLIVRKIRLAYKLRPRYERLRATGLLTRKELATKLGVSESTIKQWRYDGLLTAAPYNDRSQYLYDDPGDAAPIKYKNNRKAAAASLLRT